MSDHRRDFLKTGLAWTALSRGRVLGANDRIRIGGIGVGGRAQSLLGRLAAFDGVEIHAVADVYEPRRLAAITRIAPAAREFADYRKLLDDKDIDAVVIGSPDHWHVRMVVDAVRAGKDVYVEKPLTRTIEEGQTVLDAVRPSHRIVQVGYQQRSSDVFLAGLEAVRAGRLGKITLVSAYWYQNYVRRGQPPALETDRLDWNAWLGDAPKRAPDALRYTYWRWFWDYGGGALTDLFSHWVDVIHWYLGADTPLSAQAMGSNPALPEFECPDTINASFTYPNGVLVTYNGTLAGSLDGGGIVFRGTRGILKINREGLAIYPEGIIPAERGAYPEPEMTVRTNRDGTIDHLQNFLDCLRSRKQPNSTVETAVAAARAAHLGNLALRRNGGTVVSGPAGL